MLRAYCEEHERDWDTGIPLLLFATREVPVESLGYSPFELIFGHNIRGPLKIMHEALLQEDESPINVCEYVSKFQERLIETLDHAHSNLGKSQSKMKSWYDKNSRERKFEIGDKVLILLPTFGQPLHCKFSGPYTVIKK